MRIKKKSFLLKLIFSGVVIYFLVGVWNKSPSASQEWEQRGLNANWASLRDFAKYHGPRFKTSACVSAAKSWRITANFTMNSVLDALSLTSGFQLPVTTTAAMSRADKTQTVPDTEPLQVIVIPHSHNDPGWKKTYREYFDDQTTHILSLMVKKLHEYPDMTFIWVESTFLDTWWLNQTLETRSRFKELVDSGRLEIASGMWVAPDEASPHYFALVDQMIEGHYWVKKNLGIVPESSLNYDQFGYSSTMPYLNKLAGIKHVLIKRINRWVKEKLGTQHRMNFRWRQIWDSQGLDDIFAHVDTYEWMSISDSCGPDRPTCMKLDFKEQPDLPDPNKPVPPAGGRIPLETLANSLVEQFRLKNANYKYNVMMLPHGGDFRFDTEYEWDKQYRNMKIFMKYVNERKDFNVHLRFGTLKDFFMEVDRQTEKYGLNYQVVTGDFYSYTENQDYWTGYFTTRQFNKRLGREVLESLRSAELFAAVAISGHVDGQVRQQILSDLVIARKNLGIFQHHDAITGTSKKHVARDYELLLTSAFTSSQRVLATAVQLLLSGDGSNSKLSGLMPLLARPTENRLTRQVLLPMYQAGTQLLLVNSLTQSRRELVSLLVPVSNITIIDYKNNEVAFDLYQVASGTFKINFVVDFPPLGLVILTVKQSNKNRDQIENGVKVEVVTNSNRNNIRLQDTEKTRMTCENSLMNVTFSLITGTPERLCYHGKQFCARMQIDWRWFQERGGAYASITHGRSVPLTTANMTVKSIRGSYTCGIEVTSGFYSYNMTLTLVHSSPGQALKVTVLSDLSKAVEKVGNFAMRVKTDIKNELFFVDSAGLQMMGRKFRKDLPFDGNIYPMSSMAILEDAHARLVVHSAQPHGVVGSTSGEIDFMLDRVAMRPEMDLPEPVKDNKPTLTTFFMEMLPSSIFEGHVSMETTVPTINSIFLNDLLQHPIYAFSSHENGYVASKVKSFLHHEISCDFVLANVKNLAYSNDNLHDGLSLTVFRRAYGCHGNLTELFCPVNNEAEIIPDAIFNPRKANPNYDVREMFLSHLKEKRKLGSNERVRMRAMDIKTFHLRSRE